MSENKMYSLNKVDPCRITPEKIQYTYALANIYQRDYKLKVNATMCGIKHMRLKWYCGWHDSSSIDAKLATITTDIEVAPKMCEHAERFGFVRLHERDIKFFFNRKHEQYFNEGDVSESNRNECGDRTCITHDTYETYMQNFTLNVNYKDGSVNNYNGHKFPCPLSDGGCGSTSLDPRGYTWDQPENCLLSIITYGQIVKMLKSHTDYYMISNSTSEDAKHYMLQVYNDPKTVCGKPQIVYPTNYESLFVSYQQGFDMDNGQKRPNSEFLDDSEIHKMKSGSKYGTIHRPDTPNTAAQQNTIIDYETHIGTKLDFLHFRTLDVIKQSELHLLKQQCELERTQLMTNLVLSQENTRLAGYMLTGNRSMFLETNGKVAWLFHCPKSFSPVAQQDKCYNRIPIHYNGQTHFVDPVSRQTFLYADEQDCSSIDENLFQLDVENEESWFRFSPAPTHFNAPLLFAPKDITPKTKNDFYHTQKAGMYTPKQLQTFWDDIILHSASKDALKKITMKILENNKYDHSSSSHSFYDTRYVPQHLYVDSLISPDFFNNKFKETFGFLGYWMEKLAIYFAFFLLVRFLAEALINLFASLRYNKLTNNAFGLTKWLVAGTCGIFLFPLVESMLAPKPEQAPTEEKDPILQEHNGEERSTIDETCFTHQDSTYLNFQRKPIYPQLERCNAVITEDPPSPIYATINQNDSYTPTAPI